MKNMVSNTNLLLINVICLTFLIINTKLLLIDSVWDYFVLIFLFIQNLSKLIENFKMKKNESN